jgi:hypothetical protein
MGLDRGGTTRHPIEKVIRQQRRVVKTAPVFQVSFASPDGRRRNVIKTNWLTL